MKVLNGGGKLQTKGRWPKGDLTVTDRAALMRTSGGIGMKWLKLKLGLAALVAVLAVLTLVLILVPLVFVIVAVYMVLWLAALLLHFAFAPVVWLSRPIRYDALPVRMGYARPVVRSIEGRAGR